MKHRTKTFVTHPYVRKVLVFLAVAILCSAITLTIMSWKPEEQTTSKNTEAQITGMPVSVRSVEPKAYPAIITALGEVVPLWQTTIRTQVDGQIVFLSERLQVGNTMKKGELLVQIAKSDFEMQVAEAKSRLAAAKVVLLREEREAWEAQKNWEQSGIRGKPESPLVLRKPQVTAARSDVDAAQAALIHAKILLGYTDIRSPYDGVIMQRVVNQGETLFTGGEVVTLYSMKTVEVGVHLNAAQWALLPETVYDAKVRLTDPQQAANWDASVVREGRHLSRDSRLRTIFLQVEQPLDQTPPLLPGTFVRAEITGQSIPGLLCIPEPALTKQGRVWFADSDNRLQARLSEPVFYGEGLVYIRTPEDMASPVRVAVSPNSSFTSGLLIQPIADKGGQ